MTAVEQVAMMDFAVSVREAFRFIFRDSNFGAKSSREQKIRWRQICITTELNLNLKVHYIHVHDANWPCSYISLVWCYVPVIICFISSGGILGGGCQGSTFTTPRSITTTTKGRLET